ncbi:glycosyltransferase [Spirosoma rigui]|uniref:glycosyltransferase n=1 Tax=Spirosoma rigui TaxID=564064 RepID=UPI002936E094|nr:glycosyltransferase [Spirosoma rigui]
MILLTGYLTFNVLYLFVSAVAGRLGSADNAPGKAGTNHYRRIAVLIPAYKEDAVIRGSVIANLQLDYPRDRFDLIVIADSFLPETLAKLAEYPIQIMPVSFEQSTVQKSIAWALNHLPDDTYDIVLISDADNHMAPDFLTRINAAFAQGWRAVQGHRTAKNTNTSVAVFDAMNEEVNNTIFRAGQRALGLSVTLSGSGMAFEPGLMKQALNQIKTVGGYDKELEMLLALAHVPIGYLSDAIIYDEKVQNVAVFNKQRTRWVAAQVYFVKAYFRTGIAQLFKGNGNAFNALVKALLFPRMILLALLGLAFLITLLAGYQPGQLVTGTLFFLLVFSLLVSVPGVLWRKVSIRDFLVLPSLIFGMFLSLLKFKQAGKKFLHTPHAETTEPG